MNKHWKISYIQSSGRLIIIEHPHRELAIYGKNYSKRAALQLLNRWVRLKAHDYLSELLHQLNRRVKVNYKKVIIRSHEAQWGSYSSGKTLSLNFKLIFLPTTLAKHIVYHELCHARYLSHSEEFWQELARFDKHWQKNNKAMDEALKYIPEWVMF